MAGGAGYSGLNPTVLTTQQEKKFSKPRTYQVDGETVTIGPHKPSGDYGDRLRGVLDYKRNFGSQSAVQQRIKRDEAAGGERTAGMRAYIEDLRLRRLRASRSMLLTSAGDGRVSLG